VGFFYGLNEHWSIGIDTQYTVAEVVRANYRSNWDADMVQDTAATRRTNLGVTYTF